MQRFASFEPDTEAVTWFSGELSFRRHRSCAFGKTNQAPIQRFDVKCIVILIQASVLNVTSLARAHRVPVRAGNLMLFHGTTEAAMSNP